MQTGRVRPANRDTFRRFLARFDGARLVAAVEAMTGWRFIVEELERVGAEVHLAEPAETSAKRGPKRRAKTDRLDVRLLRQLLVERRLPEARIPPAHILDLRARVRLRKALVDQRTEWLQRIHAVLFHHGVPTQAGRLGRLEGGQAREQLSALDLPAAAQQQIQTALAIIAHLNAQLRPLDLELERDARRLRGCRALMAHYGIGAKVATAILAELGDARRFSASRRAVRHAGLDITVHESDARRRGGHLSREGSPVLGADVCPQPSIFAGYRSIGCPGIVVPMGFGSQGLPMKLSFIGTSYSEGKLLSTPTTTSRPPGCQEVVP